MTDYRVIIPDDYYDLVRFRQEELPGVGVINSALREFEPKVVFAWHFSLMVHFEDLLEEGMPTKAETELLKPWENKVDSALKGDAPEKPNALFLARITWNATRELIYRVYDPEPANDYVTRLIDEKDHPRPFDYRIDPDEKWALADWHLNTALEAP